MIASPLLALGLAAVAAAGPYHYNPYPNPNPGSYISYSVVTGLFQQDDNSTDASTFNFTASNFGLIDRTYPSDSSYPRGQHPTGWQRLAHYISTLNKNCRSDERYTLLFLGRHGEGYHNAAQTYFGTPAWNCYYSELDGNATVTWADAHLTASGISQAQTVNKFWAHLIADEKITTPETYYTSPLYRCLDTARISFDGLDLPRNKPFVPTIKELFREGISGHTCDRRSNKTFIHHSFPSYKIEQGFTENDELWEKLHGETTIDQAIRSKAVLDDVFTNDKSTYISVTSHSGEIASILSVLGHRTFSLSTGAAIPVLVKAVTNRGDAPTTTTEAYTALATCAAAPTITASTCNDCSCCQ